MVADNFYIALYDEKNDLLSFPYYVDEVGSLAAPRKPGKGLTEYVLRTAKSLLRDDALFEELKQRGEVELIGAHSPIWLGVPLIIADQAIGVMAVQDYKNAWAYGEREQRILEFVSSQVAMAIHRKQGEAALQESESSLQGILRSTADGILAVSRENKVLYANERFAEIWRIPPAVMASKDDSVLLQHVLDQLSDSQSFLKKVQELYKSDEESFDTLYFKDGRVFERLSRPLVQEAGLRGRVWSFRDITERKQAEEQIRRAQQQMEMLVTSSTVMLYTCEAFGDFDATFISGNIYAIIGYTNEEFLSKGFWVSHIHPEDAPKVFKGLAMLFEQNYHKHEYRFMLKDGTYHWMHDELRLFRDSSGNPLDIFGTWSDITERKQAEEILKSYSEHLQTEVEQRTRELREAHEQLIRQERLVVLGQLAGSVSHELRNPMAIILNAVYFLKLVQPDADEKVKEYLGMIEQETHTAEKIITDLLDFARIKSVDQEAVTVSELVQRVLKRYPAPPSVSVMIDLPPDLPPVYADPRQMEQVLGNLVLNAYQAMPEGGSLSISAVNRKDEIAIAVTDTGVGIPPENMEKLFEPLFTTKTKGIGLGLAVSRKLVEANAGRIEVQSEPGKGSIFTVYLPVAK